MRITYNKSIVPAVLTVTFGVAAAAQFPILSDAAKAVDDVGKHSGVAGLQSLVAVTAVAYAWWLTWTTQKANAKVVNSLIKIGANLESISRELQGRPCFSHMHDFNKKQQTPNPFDHIGEISSDTPV